MLTLQTPHQEIQRIRDQHEDQTKNLLIQHHLFDDLRQAIQDGIDSGPGIPSDQLFAELNARYADHHA